MIELFSGPKGHTLRFDYNPRIIEAIKRIVGANGKPLAWYSALDKSWTLPSHTPSDKLEALMRRFNGADYTAKKPMQLEDVPPLPDLEIELPILRPLFPFQAKGVAYTMLKKRTFIGDDMGLGKTTQAVASCVATDRKCILIVCPSAVKPGWKKEFKTVAGWESIILTDAIKNTWAQYHKIAGVRVFITNYESLKKFFVVKINKDKDGKFKSKDVELTTATQLFDCVIFDESHKVKESTTQTSKFCMALATGREYRFCLTGTALVNKPINLFTQLAILGYFNPRFDLPFGTPDHFKKRYCGGYSGQGATNLQELGNLMKRTCYYRREKREVFSEMPKIMRNMIPVEITNRHEYEKAENSLATYLREIEGKSSKEIEKSLRAEIMVTFQKCLHISALGKLEAVFDRIDEIMEADEKYLLFAINHDVIDLVMKRYISAVKYTGSENADQRAKAISTFTNNPRCQLIVISIDAGGTGLDGLQKVCSRGGFIQFPWHPAKANQAEARLDRIGQLERVGFDYFIGQDTRDERVMEIIEAKRNITAEVFGEEMTAEVNFLDDLFKK